MKTRRLRRIHWIIAEALTAFDVRPPPRASGALLGADSSFPHDMNAKHSLFSYLKLGRVAVALLFLNIGSDLRALPLDQNGDGRPDIWTLLYKASAMLMGADTDGDGESNGDEAAAGTDPWKPNSLIRVSRVWRDILGVHLQFATLEGKRYQIQSASAVSGVMWGNSGPLTAGTGGEVSVIVASPAGTQSFYRVAVFDTDSDTDGVTDWEEMSLGFNPANSRSGGISSPDDLAAITQALAAPNEVSVIAGVGDAAEAGLKAGSFSFLRKGGLSAVTVRYSISGTASPGADYAALTGSVTFPMGARVASVGVTPLADSLLESPETVIVTLTADPAYTVAPGAVAAVLIDDAVSPTGRGLRAEYYNEASSGTTQPTPLIGASFPAGGFVLTREDATVNFDWPSSSVQGTGSPAVGVTVDNFSSRWSGEVLPQFSQVYTFFFDVNLGGRVWVNGVKIIDNWPPKVAAGGNYSGSILLEGGVRYPIVVEQYETTGSARARLSWRSANQTPDNIAVIVPSARLFPVVPPQILSERAAYVLQNSGTYTYAIVASSRPTSYSAANLPPGFSISTTTGVITGSPGVAGVWQIPITATNAVGSGSTILELSVLATGGAITREVWTGIAGSDVSTIPTSLAPASTGVVNALEGVVDFSDNYGERLRGYITAPQTGEYRFWLAADDAAELWISNDDEPVNNFRRASLTSGTALRDWATAAQSPLLHLVAGRRYYLEVLHKDGGGTDHVSVGWSRPGESDAVPTQVVPGYALTPFVEMATQPLDHTLYTTSMTPQGANATGGSGAASLRLSTDETQANLRFTYTNLTSPVTSKHIHSDTHGGAIIFDIDDAPLQLDGTYTWPIVGLGALSAADVIGVIKSGNAYINIHTANFTSGEIRGNFRVQASSQKFTPPPAPPALVDDHQNANAASRFLMQATFGPTPADIESLRTSAGFGVWIEDQFTRPTTLQLPLVQAYVPEDPLNPFYPGDLTFNAWWKNSISAPDQLRQRLTFALSEILVVSEAGVLEDKPHALSYYYDRLADMAFGNFRDILRSVTLTPAMGLYLDMRKNDKPDATTGRIPNENYAREILQLFSIGLNRLHPDGSLMLDSEGEPVPTYDQDAVVGFSHVFTGWNYNQVAGAQTDSRPAGLAWDGVTSDYDDPMMLVPNRHFTGRKRILNNVVLPGLPMLSGAPLDPFANHTIAQVNGPAYLGLGHQELDAALDAIFLHPNVGPFICRQLIQRFVTSTPSRGYLYRVVQKFNDDGSAQRVRGNMRAVIKAILLDYEARDRAAIAPKNDLVQQGVFPPRGYGKQREPLLRVTAVARAFRPAADGTFSMNSTGTDLQQTPLNSPTVFNFFESDYLYPGELSALGIVTPEFQLTSDTTVIRSANFLYGGLFNNTTLAGLSSFRGGAIQLDLSPWIAPLPAGGFKTDSGNIPALVDEFNTLLMGGQMSDAMKTILVTYVRDTRTGYYPYSSLPTETERRDRIRAIVHLMITSPEYTIQK